MCHSLFSCSYSFLLHKEGEFCSGVEFWLILANHHPQIPMPQDSQRESQTFVKKDEIGGYTFAFPLNVKVEMCDPVVVDSHPSSGKRVSLGTKASP